MSLTVASLRAAVASASTEAGEKAAVAKALAAGGYRKQPSVQTHRNGRNVVRTYLWRDTPAGSLALVTGPSMEGAVYEVQAVQGDVDAEDVSLYLPKQGRRSAYVAWKRGKGPQRRRNNPAPRNYIGQVGAGLQRPRSPR